MKSSIKFVRQSKYVYCSTDKKYELVCMGSTYCLKINKKAAKWQPVFLSVEAASRFIVDHLPIEADSEFVKFSSDDIEFIIDYYGFEPKANGVWAKKVPENTLLLTLSPEEFLLNVESENGTTSTSSYKNVSDLLLELDQYIEEDEKILEDINSAIRITAATNSRDIAKNLVRVKSSNIWAYGINLEDKKDKEGTVVVQFKGNQGGPGDIYVYYDVPVVIWRKWLSAASKGHYFWQFIRNNFYYRKLTGDKRGKLKNALN